MYSTLALIAFSLPLSTQPGKVAWQHSYREARASGIAKHRPLVMFVAAGKDGWKKILADGAFEGKIEKILAEKYVALFIDRDSPEGRKTAVTFGLGSQPAMIISSRTGDLQAFRHEGTLTETDLTVCLNRYSSASHVVTTTESLWNAVSHVSTSYASPAPAYQNYYVPTFGSCST